MPLDVKQAPWGRDGCRQRTWEMWGRLPGVHGSEDVGAFWTHPECGDRSSKLIETWSIERLMVAILSASFFAGAPEHERKWLMNVSQTWFWITLVGFLQSNSFPSGRNTRHGHWAGINISYSRMLPVILFWGPALGVATLAGEASWRAPFPLKLGVLVHFIVYIYII